MVDHKPFMPTKAKGYHEAPHKSQTSQRTAYPLLSSIPRVSLCSQYFVDSLQISYSFVALCFLSSNNAKLMLMICCARWDIDAQEINSHVLMR